jgi:SdrD B-like domain/Secretion system C-terminal sorting domain
VQNFLVKVKESEIKGKTDNDYSINLLDGDLPVPQAGITPSVGIRLDGGWAVHLEQSSVSSCDIGVRSVSPANVILSNYSQIAQCKAGISSKGNGRRGLVLMDCSGLIGNGTGILGRDILLMIDPEEVKQNTDVTLPGNFNRFVRKSAPPVGCPNLYFDICYVFRPNPSAILARKMFWGKEGTTSSYPVEPSPLNFIRFFGEPACSGNLNGRVNMEDALVGGIMLFCAAPNPDDPQFTASCEQPVTFGNTTYTFSNYFERGYKDFVEQRYTDAFNKFKQLAGTGSSWNSTCSKLEEASISLSDESGTVVAGVSIGNFVWHDLNGNGVQDAGEPGIKNASVQLTGTNSAGQAVSLTRQTDPGGYYGFDNIAPGTYKIKVPAPTGYVVTTANVGDDAKDSDISVGTYTTGNVVLTAGQLNFTVDAGFKTSPGAVELVVLINGYEADASPGVAVFSPEGGGTATVTYRVRNIGSLALSNVQVAELSYAGSTLLFTAPSLAVGATTTFTKVISVGKETVLYQAKATAQPLNSTGTTYGGLVEDTDGAYYTGTGISLTNEIRGSSTTFCHSITVTFQIGVAMTGGAPGIRLGELSVTTPNLPGVVMNRWKFYNATTFPTSWGYKGGDTNGNGYLDYGETFSFWYHLKLPNTAENLSWADATAVLWSPAANETELSWGAASGGSNGLRLTNTCWMGFAQQPNTGAGVESRSAEEQQQIFAEQIKVFPNPAHHEVNLILPETAVQVRVFDATGRVLHASKATGQDRIDTQSWQSGLYFIEVADRENGRTHRVKLVVQP